MLTHPAAGDLHVAYEVLALPDVGDQRLVTWLPADDEAALVLQHLVADEPSGPVRLRVVGDT